MPGVGCRRRPAPRLAPWRRSTCASRSSTPVSTRAAINTALDAVAEGQLTGLDQGFGGYFDSLAAEALIRLGRWPEAAAILARHPIAEHAPGRSASPGASEGDARGPTRRHRPGTRAARRGQRAARRRLASVRARRSRRRMSTSRSGTGTKRLTRPSEAGNRRRTTSVLWAARFAMLSVAATVERTLDDRARREPVDVAATISRLQAANRRRSIAGSNDRRAQPGNVTRRRTSPTPPRASPASPCPTPMRGPRPPARWTELGDRWATATALVREAEAAAAGRRGGSGGIVAPTRALDRRPSSAPHRLLAEIEAVSRRTRISVEAPTRVVARRERCPAARTDAPGSGGARLGGGRANEPPDRRRALRLGQDGKRARLEHLAKARREQPRRRRRRCPTARHRLRPRRSAAQSTGCGFSSVRRRSWALSATTIVDRLISTAPTAGERVMPAQANAPAASGIASRL